MSIQIATPLNSETETLSEEHSLTLDGVIELVNHTNKQDFFDGLLDTVIDYIEQHNGIAALSLNHNKLTDELPSD